MRTLLWFLGIVDLVITIDFNGERRLRIVWYDNEGQPYVNGICGFASGSRPTINLLSNGAIKHISRTNNYVDKWVRWPENKKKQSFSFLRKRNISGISF